MEEDKLNRMETEASSECFIPPQRFPFAVSDFGGGFFSPVRSARANIETNYSKFLIPPLRLVLIINKRLSGACSS